MKKTLLFIFLLPILVVSYTSAQSIDGFTVVPSNPTENDAIKVYVHLTFGSGTCDQHTQSLFITGNDISGNALHCLGMLTVICDYTDTFLVGQLTAGVYHFTFQLNTGLLPSPCSPGIVAGPVDSFSFEVGVATEISNPVTNGIHFSIYPIPTNEGLSIEVANAGSDCDLAIFSLDGKKIFSETLKEPSTYLGTGSLPNGIYLAEITNDGKKERKLFVIQH